MKSTKVKEVGGEKSQTGRYRKAKEVMESDKREKKTKSKEENRNEKVFMTD